MVKPVKIILADAQYLIREGLKALFATQSNIRVIDESSEKLELFTKLKKHRPDILILDYNHQVGFCVNDISLIQTISPDIKILIIADISNKETTAKAIEQGVMGFLTKTCDKAEIIEAISGLIKGEKMYCYKVLQLILDHPIAASTNCEATVLSDREIEVIKLIANGYTTKQIAETLYRSFHTISTHRKNIMKKLSIKTTSELMMYAVNTGLIQTTYDPPRV